MKVLLLVVALAGCTTPFSVTGGFMGASVTVDLPQGIRPVAVGKVVSAPAITEPALLVPTGSVEGAAEVATVRKVGGAKVVVPVVEAPVSQPTLAIPKG